MPAGVTTTCLKLTTNGLEQRLVAVVLVALLLILNSYIQKLSKGHIFRRNCWQIFCKLGFLKSLAKFTGKHLRQSLFLIKLQA